MEVEKVTYSASGKASIRKDPLEVLDYVFKWQSYLDPLGDFIVSADFVCDPGITVDEFQLIDGYTVMVVLSGGLDGRTYRVACRIRTEGDPERTVVRSLYVKVVNR